MITIATYNILRGHHARLRAVLGREWTDALPDLPWSFDISYTAPQNNADIIVKMCRPLGILMRARLDYLFTRNLTIASAEMLDLPGSDHRQLVARFHA